MPNPLRALMRPNAREGLSESDVTEDELREMQKAQAEEKMRRIGESESRSKSRFSGTPGGGLGLAAVAGLVIFFLLYILIAMGFKIG